VARSALTSPRVAPISVEISASISCAATIATASRRKSACSSIIVLATTSGVVMLWLSAIVVLLHRLGLTFNR
jgi:hypothetical protein